MESLAFAPTAQGLARGQAGPLSQLRCQLPFQGSLRRHEFAQAFSVPVLRTAPHQSGLRPASFPKGKLLFCLQTRVDIRRDGLDILLDGLVPIFEGNFHFADGIEDC